MENDNTKQTIKGNNNSQTTVIVNGNYCLPNITEEQVIQLIKDTCLIDKEAVVKIVKDVIDEIEIAKRVSPNKRYFIPIINQLSYSLDDDVLKEAYKKLLKSSLNSDFVDDFHPAFISVINQLNSDEIKLLDSLPKGAYSLNPLIDIRIKFFENNGKGIIIISNFSDLGYGMCQKPHRIGAYIENLERLKLIEIPTNSYISEDNVYQLLINHPAVQAKLNSIKHEDGPEFKFEFDKKYFHLTMFGIQFLKCCR